MCFSIPKMQIRQNAILIYEEIQRMGRPYKSLLRIGNMRQQQKKQYGGTMTAGAKKRLARATTLLCQSAKKEWLYNDVTQRMQLHQLTFITLTVSDPTQKLSGKEAYKQLLSHFLQWLRRTKNVTTYLWKAELQQNGQIHYHLTTPSFVNCFEIRDKWNNLQRKAGLLDAYNSIHDHFNANSTDAHEVMNVDNTAGYILKYITKEYQNIEALGGKIWDCSENLKKNKYFTVDLSEAHKIFLYNAVMSFLADCYTGDHFSIYKFREPPQEHLLSKEEFREFRTFLKVIREGKVYQRQEEKVKWFVPIPTSPENTLKTELFELSLYP